MGRLRSSEWILVVFFGYVALVSLWFPLPASLAVRPFLLATGAFLFLRGMAAWEAKRGAEALSIVRDYIPLGLALAAYRAMDWFSPVFYDHHLENLWVRWDRTLLDAWHLRAAIESLGNLLPSYLELCYALVYTVGVFAVTVLVAGGRRERVNRFLVVYLAGTLCAYALFPYFPSEPPRTAFPWSDLPHATTLLRRFNLWLLGGYGIHSSVFPSAHVSSALSAAWGLFLVLPERRRFGWGLLLYAVSVAVATVYGRYHYAVDAVAGAGVSLVAAAVGWWLGHRDSTRGV